MSELLNSIEAYWTNRADGYSRVNQDELAGVQHTSWPAFLIKQIERTFPSVPRSQLRILDIGAGPGFLSIVLCEAGYCVTAADYTPAMLEQARRNAGPLAERITFVRADAQDLPFADGSFDVVLSRNLTWNLEHPDMAYQSWQRVLKCGGLLLNFDANWYNYLFDEEKRTAYEQDRANVAAAGQEDHYTCTDINSMERIALAMPLSPLVRPAWDLAALRALGMTQVEAEENVGELLWSDVEKLNYAATPMFMVRAVKG